MRKYLAILTILMFSLAIVGQCFAGYTVKPKIASVTGWGALWDRACNVKMFYVYSTTSGNQIGIYNAKVEDVSAGQVTPLELEFEVGISANNKPEPIYTGTDGVDFSSGIYIRSSDQNSKVTAILDY